MVKKIKEHFNAPIEYINNITKFGGSKTMAEYHTRYIDHTIDNKIKTAIASLNLSQFATKLDVQELRTEMQATKYSLLKWQISISIVTISSMLAMFKFFMPH